MHKLLSIYFLTLCYLLVSGHTVTAAPEAEYKKLSKTYTLHEDGSQEYRYSMELTLFTHTAMNSTYGESFIVYNPAYQELIIHSSYTKQKDGNVVTTPENAFVEVLPRQAVNAPAFNHLKEMVVVHTGLELGATIYLDYSVVTKSGYLPALDIYEEISQTSPVKEYTITLSVPEQTPLFYTLGGVTAKEQQSVSNGRKQVQWVLRNLPAASRAPLTRAANGDVPFLTASSYGSEEAALQQLAQQFLAGGDLQLLTFAEALTEGKASDREKMLAISTYVTEQLDGSRLTLAETGFKMRSLPDITKSAYATEAEKAYMLFALLKVLDIPAQPVASYKVNAGDNSRGLSAVNELFVIVQAGNRTYWLSPSTNRIATGAFYHSQVPVVSITQPSTPVAAPELNTAIRYKAELKLSETDVQGKAEVKTGEALTSYTSYTSGQMDTVSFATGLDDYSGYMAYTLPDVKESMAYTPYVRFNSSRKEILRLPYRADEEYIYTIGLPAGITLVTPEGPHSLSNKVGTIEVNVSRSGSAVTVSRTLQINTELITPSLYPDFRQLMTEWGDVHNKMLLFNKAD